MYLKELSVYFTNSLSGLYPDKEIESLMYTVYAAILGCSRFQISQTLEKRITKKELIRIKQIINELKSYQPIQYVLGETEFYGCTIKVGKGVLIPRPETEELADWIIKSENPRTILDIGTGSGCLAIVLAKHFSEGSVYALDNQSSALSYAHKNVRLNEVNVTLIEHDIFLETFPDSVLEFDLIVSNPPYVRESETKFMEQNVLGWEPKEALFVPDQDPLIYYSRIIKIADKILKKHGRLYFEINEAFGESVRKAFKENNYFDIEIALDISGKKRFVRATKS